MTRIKTKTKIKTKAQGDEEKASVADAVVEGSKRGGTGSLSVGMFMEEEGNIVVGGESRRRGTGLSLRSAARVGRMGTGGSIERRAKAMGRRVDSFKP